MLQLFALHESQRPLGLAGPLKILQAPQPPESGVKKAQAEQVFCASGDASV
jgi:hypothetical protein